jgi:hypothetical protein
MICRYCQTTAKYKCPQCRIAYCSLSCFQSKEHSECSEGFYQQQVLETLQKTSGSKESKSKMMELLQKLYEEDCGVEEIPEIDANGDFEDVFGRLSLEQKQEFEAWIKSESWSAIVPEFVPWWQESMIRIGSELAVKVPALHDPGEQALLSCQKAHPDLIFSIVDLLFAYVVVCYHTLGEHAACPEFITLFQSISYYLELELSTPRNVFLYHSMDEVLDMAFSRLRMTGLLLSQQSEQPISIREEEYVEKSEKIILQSVVHLLEPKALPRAFSDIYQCFHGVKHSRSQSIMKRVSRKLEFLLALSQTLPQDQLRLMQAEVSTYSKRLDQSEPKQTYIPLIQVIEE